MSPRRRLVAIATHDLTRVRTDADLLRMKISTQLSAEWHACVLEEGDIGGEG
jgi:hypothetical protein